MRYLDLPRSTFYYESIEKEKENELGRHYDDQEELAVIVSDLTYVHIKGQWNYICFFIELFNRELLTKA